MDTLGPQAFSLSFGNFKIIGGEELDPSDPPPPHPTVDIRLVNPCIKKEDEAETTEDDTLNTPVSTSSDVNTFFLADTTISDPVPITGELYIFFDFLFSLSCDLFYDKFNPLIERLPIRSTFEGDCLTFRGGPQWLPYDSYRYS